MTCIKQYIEPIPWALQVTVLQSSPVDDSVSRGLRVQATVPEFTLRRSRRRQLVNIHLRPSCVHAAGSVGAAVGGIILVVAIVLISKWLRSKATAEAQKDIVLRNVK